MGKPHTIGEEFILSVANEFTYITIGEKVAKQLYCAPLETTELCRMQDVAANVKDDEVLSGYQPGQMVEG
jgi:hypothetical protein